MLFLIKPFLNRNLHQDKKRFHNFGFFHNSVQKQFPRKKVFSYKNDVFVEIQAWMFTLMIFDELLMNLEL